MANNFVLSNIVEEKNLRKVQLQTLRQLRDSVSLSAGPYGGLTQILSDPDVGSVEYTKDGHKILKNIKYYTPLELSIQDELVNSTRNIVKTVGDGTTSVVKLTYSVFAHLCEYIDSNNNIPKFSVIEQFKRAAVDVSKVIYSNGRQLTLDDVYKICMVSTDGNTEVSSRIMKLYEDYGLDVYINLGISNTPDHIVKSYDGLTMQRGFASPCFINRENNTCVINKPRLYCFDDPIDTPQMGDLFSAIITNNIISRANTGDYIPTVILAHSISRDFSVILEGLEKYLYQYDGVNKSMKPPILIISGLNRDVDFYNDLTLLCGAKTIKKYIDPAIQDKDIENGLAPTVETVSDFYGTLDEIISDNDNTTFINPSKMFTTEGEGEDAKTVPAQEYTSLVEFLKAEIKKCEDEDSNDATTLHMLRRRLRSLQSNYVEYLVGGIAVADRESSRDLVEDAVLNCRSAAIHGVGYGANFEMLMGALRILSNIKDIKESGTIAEPGSNDDIYENMVLIIYRSAYESISSLYASCIEGNRVAEVISACIKHAQPLNIRTFVFQEDVLCTIDSDPMILDTIAKLTTLMFNTNQALLVSPLNNKYIDKDKVSNDDGTEQNLNI